MLENKYIHLGRRSPKSRMRDSAVRKSLRLLRSLMDEGDATLTQLAVRTELNVSTAHRLLKMLAGEHFVKTDVSGKVYSTAVGWSNESHPLLLPAIERTIQMGLKDLAESSGETCAFNAFDPVADKMVLVCIARSPKPLGYEFEIGRQDFLNAGASGKAILAFLPRARREFVIARYGLPAATDRTQTDVQALERELEEIRDKGYSVSHGERVAGAVGFAAPLFDENAQILGSVLITVPDFRADDVTCATMLHKLTAFSKKINAKLSSVSGDEEA